MVEFVDCELCCQVSWLRAKMSSQLAASYVVELAGRVPGCRVS